MFPTVDISKLQLYTRQQALDSPGQSLSRAIDNGAAGETTIVCHVEDDNSIDECIVLRELPPRHDYGRMAAYDILRKGKGSTPGAWVKLRRFASRAA